MFANIHTHPTNPINIHVVRQSVLDNLASFDSVPDDSMTVSRFGAVATFYKTYDELGVASNDPEFRWKAFDAFLRSEDIHCSDVRPGVCGLIVFASIPGTPNSGSVYWFHEPTRSVWSLYFDEGYEGIGCPTGAYFGQKDFQALYEAHNLSRLTGPAGIPTQQKPDSLYAQDLPFAA